MLEDKSSPPASQPTSQREPESMGSQPSTPISNPTGLQLAKLRRARTGSAAGCQDAAQRPPQTRPVRFPTPRSPSFLAEVADTPLAAVVRSADIQPRAEQTY